MAKRAFRPYEPDRPLPLPPDLRHWLPADHLAWFVLEVVDHLDLEPLYRAHRADGHGRAGSPRPGRAGRHQGGRQRRRPAPTGSHGCPARLQDPTLDR